MRYPLPAVASDILRAPYAAYLFVRATLLFTPWFCGAAVCSVGIYDKQERQYIIERYMAKRSRRVWQKKIRYNCRKNLADRRIRVKGRFVKAEMAASIAFKVRHALGT